MTPSANHIPPHVDPAALAAMVWDRVRGWISPMLGREDIEQAIHVAALQCRARGRPATKLRLRGAAWDAVRKASPLHHTTWARLGEGRRHPVQPLGEAALDRLAATPAPDRSPAAACELADDIAAMQAMLAEMQERERRLAESVVSEEPMSRTHRLYGYTDYSSAAKARSRVLRKLRGRLRDREGVRDA